MERHFLLTLVAPVTLNRVIWRHQSSLRTHLEIRMVRSRQPDPLALIMFDWVLGADLFLPWREQAPIGHFARP
jgi:hypothetical protein